jgi:hypothetical protein
MDNTSYYEFVNQLKAKFGSFIMDAEAGAENKSAALRARKLSMELRKDLQDFRGVSVENDKVNTRHRGPKDEAAPTATPAAGEPVAMPEA